MNIDDGSVNCAMKIQKFLAGEEFHAYQFFGAHILKKEVVFRLYAESVEKVAVIGDFSDWNDVVMATTEHESVYSVVVPNAKKGMLYKYRVYAKDGSVVEHCDPFGFAMELRPGFASIITDLQEYRFLDETWLLKREKNYNRPMNIYEVHLASFQTNPQNEHGFFTYEELADRLIAHVKEHHFNYIECMPLSEHPADCSWGYQNTGFYAPTSRYGAPLSLMKFVDKCHQAGIGVILDFVPVHFAIDEYGLAKFGGQPCFEYPYEDISVSEWGTLNFNHTKGSVASFIQSAANYWLQIYHFDGIRMDAISRAIYWQGDPRRGVNTGAVNFIKRMNKGLHKYNPNAMLIAEDSTDFLKVTAPVAYDGLGFDYKWDMGFMNDTLEFFKLPPVHRPANYGKLIFSMQYFYQELFLLAFSHDEVVHGKATIIQKMWGDYDVKFPQARALYAYFFTHPGKKLNFMGNEIAQFREWDEKREQDWDILSFPMHKSFQQYYKDLCFLYQTEKSLYDGEYNKDCFAWLESSARNYVTYAYSRQVDDEQIVVVLNFSDQFWSSFPIAVSTGKWKELLNSDWEMYGGCTKKTDQNIRCSKNAEHRCTDSNRMDFNRMYTLFLDLAPFSARIFKTK